MADSAPTELLHRSAYLECPRWHDGALWVSDFYEHVVLRVAPDGHRTVVAEVPGQPAGLGWLSDGRLVVASMLDRRILCGVPGGPLEVLADLSGLTRWPLNDLVVDPSDNVFVGEFGFDVMSYAPLQTGSVIRVRPDGTAGRAADGMRFANGMAVTGAGELVVAETFAQRLSAFPIGPDGELGDRRDWASFGPVPQGPGLIEVLGGLSAAPDGICLDAEGAAWVADCIGSRAVRVRPGGEIVEEIPAPDTGVFACALGGPDGRTLYLCCAPGFDEADRKATRESFVRAVPVGVPAPRPVAAG